MANNWLSMIMCPLGSNLISIKIHSKSLPLHALYQIGTVLACFSDCTSGLPYSGYKGVGGGGEWVTGQSAKTEP